jgi:4-carboxymuconolactone decarboxylase
MEVTAPRIPPVDEPDEDQAALLAKTLRAPDGTVLNVFATLAHSPQLLRRVNALGGYFFVHARIPPRERELVILRTAARIGSTYEIGQHRWIGAQAGLTPTEIEHAIATGSEHAWLREDAALLAFTDELIRTDTITDATWDAMAGSYDELQRAELLALIGFYRMLGGVLNGLRVQLEAPTADGNSD